MTVEMNPFGEITFRNGLMKPGDSFSPNEGLESGNGVFRLCFEKEGNLALYAAGVGNRWTKTWRSDFAKVGKAVFRHDGQLAIIPDDGSKPWESGYFDWMWDAGSRDFSKGTLVLQDDGNLVVYDSERTACWATNTWTARYALLIGVEDYTHFKGQNLRAGRNDVLAMWKLCRRLGYRPEHIRVHTSPRLTEQEIKDAEVKSWLARPENTGKTTAEAEKAVNDDLRSVGGDWNRILGDATSSAIQSNLHWFSEQLGTPFMEGKGYLVPGMLYYSGHGAKIGGQLALCPSDVRHNGAKLENALMFKDIERTLTLGYAANQEHNPVEFLTVVLDCCFAAAQTSQGDGPSKNQVATSLTLAGTAGATKKAAEPVHPWLQRRIFCAARDDEQGFQALLGGRWHGAFTWAMTQALEQWMTRQSAATLFPYVDISHAELLMRARMLLEALSFRQHPVLMDTFANTPVFWSGLARVETHGAGEVAKTSAEPTATRGAIQMTPDTFFAVYEVSLISGGGSIIAKAHVISIKANTYMGDEKGSFCPASNWEYWWIPEEFTTNMASATKVQFQCMAKYGKSGDNALDWQNFQTERNKYGITKLPNHNGGADPPWRLCDAPNDSTFYGTSASLTFGITFDGTGDSTWYRLQTESGRYNYAVTVDGATFTKSKNPQPNLKWESTVAMKG